MTEAYGLPEIHGWVYLLEQELGIEIINAGISGDTTTGMLGRCESLLKEHQPSNLLVMGGTNDVLFGLKDELIISNLHAMSRYARYYQAECIIGIPTPILDEKNLNFLGENVQKRMENYQEALRNYCDEDGKNVIDFSVNMTAKHYLDDGVHLNEIGHRQMKNMARAFFDNNIL